jgi:hypothetical protein
MSFKHYEKNFDNIIITKTGHVHGGCEAVRSGQIVLNDDYTVNENSPAVELGILDIRNDGQLDRRRTAMRNAEYRDNYNSSVLYLFYFNISYIIFHYLYFFKVSKK